jgi:hypothetical protein
MSLVRTTPFRPVAADWVHAALVAALLFGLYAATAPRTVALEDDALFVLSSYFLGIEHPPGFPLFTLLSHPFTWLPFGSVAYRVHLASAFFGALAGAAAWMCVRTLLESRLPAYVAAFGLGASPVFWSQSIIAEVYTLNAFLFLALVYLGLRACPPAAQDAPDPAVRRLLFSMALLLGLGVSNHWPLTLLVAPAFAIVLWPRRAELLRYCGALLWVVVLGLLPYVWMVRRSWDMPPVSFYGPLETLPEILFFVSRAGYAGVDRSVSADWFDRIKFFQFFGGQLFVQFAVAGTALAAIGFVQQWRALGPRIGAFLTLAFLMPSAVLLVLLGFDYSAPTKHVFHVYPLPAYAVAALWMAIGFAWLAQRYALRRTPATAMATVLIGLIVAIGCRTNLLADADWGARYAQTMLRLFPPNAVVFAEGDADLAPMMYFHLVENARPDITLYQQKGLILGSRLFHPLRRDEKAQAEAVQEMVAAETQRVFFTLTPPPNYAQREFWLFSELDKSSDDPLKLTIDVPEEALRFFEESVAQVDERNAWIAYFQGELRRRYGGLLARSLPRDAPPGERERRHLELLSKDFYGVLGITEGLLLNPKGFSIGAVGASLDRMRELMPSDVTKAHQSRYFVLRGTLRRAAGDPSGAERDFETALAIWPNPENTAIWPLQELYAQTGESAKLEALRARVARLVRGAMTGS